MFETSGKDGSFKENLDVEVVADFRMVIYFAKVTHVEPVFVEG
jgi:hypothetical protein